MFHYKSMKINGKVIKLCKTKKKKKPESKIIIIITLFVYNISSEKSLCKLFQSKIHYKNLTY